MVVTLFVNKRVNKTDKSINFHQYSLFNAFLKEYSAVQYFYIRASRSNCHP